MSENELMESMCLNCEKGGDSSGSERLMEVVFSPASKSEEALR